MMRKIIFILFVALAAMASCDILSNQNSDSLSDSLSDSIPSVNDISITAIETTPFAKRGEIKTVDITVTNSGTGTVDEEFEITLNNQSEGVIIGNKTLAPSLAPNDSIRVSFNWNTGNVTIGEQILVAKHTFEDDNAANDSLETTVTVSESDTTDIAVSDVRLPDMIEVGKVVDVEVDVKNIGNQDVNETFTIALNDVTDGKTIGTHKIESGFAKGDSTTLTYSWNTQGYSIGDHELSASHDFDDGNTANDSRTASVAINETPVTDIAVASVEAPSEATQGENVEVKINIENQGNQDVGDGFTVSLRDRTDGKQIASKTVSRLGAGGSTELTFTWNTDEASIADHTLEASHDFDDGNTANDSRTASVSITETPVTDIAVASMEAPSKATRGDHVEVSVTLRNLGNKDTAEEVTVILRDQTDNKQLASKTISGLDAEGSAMLTFMWNTDEASIAGHTLEASHDFNDGNPANDSRTASVTINEPPVTDIAVTSMEAPSEAIRGENVEVSVTVRNLGNKDTAEGFTVRLRDQTNGQQIASKTISGLEADNTVALTFDWNTDQAIIADHTLEASHDFDDGNTANDSRTASVTINETPVTDIAVASVEAPSEATQGENVEVKINIENQGNQDVSDAITITLVDQTDGSTIDSKSISGGLDAGAATSMTFNWDTKSASPGNHRLAARHNLHDDNSENDSKSIEIRIIEEIFLDIAITTIDAPDDDVEKGDKVTIEVTLSNLGDRDVNEDIIVTLVDQTENKNISLETLRDGLKISSSKTLKFVWNTRGRVKKGKHTFILSHDFADDNLVNNSRTFVIEVEDDDD